ncbi:MAG: YhbY family RNA-binding protein [Eubacteriaceae bacterium]|nr:YhbY family RNA-binding protein [Eubacteriaceae bacterium]
MITGKQRSYLKSLANSLSPTVFIGKAGLTENVISETDSCLDARELVKVRLQEGADLGAKQTANELRDLLGAEFVQAIGKTFVLYRRSDDDPKIVLP